MNISNRISNIKKSYYSEVGNNILYSLCRKYPNHNDESEIYAKIWIIGRSYAASIERRKVGNDDKKFFNTVARRLKRSSMDNDIQRYKSNRTIENALKLHNKLSKKLRTLTGNYNRSFASKYLHFHMKSSFYIYDSRASKAIGKIEKQIKLGRLKYPKYLSKYDGTYGRFFFRCERLRTYLELKYHIKMSKREFDRFLLNY